MQRLGPYESKSRIIKKNYPRAKGVVQAAAIIRVTYVEILTSNLPVSGNQS